MNVDSSMCASSGKAAHWEQIDWPQCERQVRRLQARIVKATRESRWSKVKTFHLEYEQSTPPDEAEARKEVIEEYASSLREFIKVVRNHFN